jgi:hypothetical protein
MARMPFYHFDVANHREQPFPPVADMPTIEADNPPAAMERLKAAPLKAPPGVASVWLRVVVAYHPDGSANHAIAERVQVVPEGSNN